MAYTDQIAYRDVDRAYTRVANLGSLKLCYIRSFEITKASDTQFALTVNKHQLIGKYPTINAAFGALVGCFHSLGVNEEYALEAISTMIAEGTGQYPKAYQKLTMLFSGSGVPTTILTDSSTTEDILSSTATTLEWINATDPTKFQLWWGSFTGNTTTGSGRYPFKGAAQAELYSARFKGTIVVDSINPTYDQTITLGATADDPIDGVEATANVVLTNAANVDLKSIGNFTATITVEEI